jgi:predicted amino acid dehydrogenase
VREETKFVAFDGTEWTTKEACLAHEAKHPELALVGLDVGDIHMAISRTNVALADAIEMVAGRIARKRRETGTLRRASPKKQPPAAGGGGSEPPDPQARFGSGSTS